MFSIPMKGSLSISLLNSNEFRIVFFYDELSPGFTLIWDNVGKMVMTAHRNSRRQNKMMLWALSLAAENRIFTSHMDDKNVKKAVDILLEEFIPMAKDISEIKTRMTTIVSRILVEEVPFFPENFKDCATDHLKHKHWRESSSKSNVVSTD